MVSTSWAQVKLKDAIEQPRFLSYKGLDPEISLSRISIIKDVEVCYERGLITRRQIEELDDWLSTGLVEDHFSLAATLAAIATVSQYEDETYIKNHLDMGKTEQEIRHRLLEMSSEFTVSLDVPLLIEEETNDHAMAG